MFHAGTLGGCRCISSSLRDFGAPGPGSLGLLDISSFLNALLEIQWDFLNGV